MLPTTDESGYYWLKTFLVTKFGDNSQFPYATDYDSVDRFYVEEPPRIPTYGMTQLRNASRTLLITGAEDTRLPGYYEQYHEGTAKFFHMRCEASKRVNIEEHIIQSLKYLVIASRTCNGKSLRVATRRWKVKTVTKIMRKELTADQTGTMTFARPMENYWLFSIEDDGRLSSPISKPDGHHILEFLSEK